MSKRLAELIFEASKAKRVSLPAQITPVYRGVKQAPEHPVYVTDKEEDMLRHGTDGKSDMTQFGTKSFTDPSQAQGNTLSSTPTRTTSQSRAGQSNNTGSSNSYSGYSGGYGNYGSFGSATGGGIGSGAGGAGMGYSSRTAPASYDSAASRASNGQNFSFTPSVPSHSTGSFVQPAQSQPSQQQRDNAWRSIMGNEPPAFGNRVTVASVPQIPGNSGATYTSDSRRAANLQSRNSLAAPTFAATGTVPAGVDVTQPAPKANDEQSFGDTPSFTDQKAYSGPKGTKALNTAAYEAGGMTPIASGITSSAHALGIDPQVLGTAISYETAGSFDPMRKGPVTQYGQHRGLIQFGEPQAKQFGVDWKNPLQSQLGPDGAVVQYLQKAGVKPGMGLLPVYAAINAGGVNNINATDANNGGAPGTVADKVNNQMAGHFMKAKQVLSNGYNPPAAVPTTVATSQPAPTSAVIGPTYSTAMNGGLGVVGFGPSSLLGGQLDLVNKDPANMQVYASAIPDYGNGQTQVASASPFSNPTLAGFATPAVDTPPPFTPAQIAAAQPGGAGFAPDGSINPINPNGTIGKAAPKLTQIVNAVATRPYDPRTAGNLEAWTQPGSSKNSSIVQAIVDAATKTQTPAAQPPAVQGPIGPAYSMATAQGNFIVDSHGNYFQIDALGRYVPVAAPVRAA